MVRRGATLLVCHVKVLVVSCARAAHGSEAYVAFPKGQRTEFFLFMDVGDVGSEEAQGNACSLNWIIEECRWDQWIALDESGPWAKAPHASSLHQKWITP